MSVEILARNLAPPRPSICLSFVHTLHPPQQSKPSIPLFSVMLPVSLSDCLSCLLHLFPRIVVIGNIFSLFDSLRGIKTPFSSTLKIHHCKQYRFLFSHVSLQILLDTSFHLRLFVPNAHTYLRLPAMILLNERTYSQ